MTLTRRSLLATLSASFLTRAAPYEFAADIAIIGGSVGGCAAALGALRNGMSVVLTEETAWIGGQLTSQAVPPDEHPWIEAFGRTRAYADYRTAVRDYYRRHYPLTAEARSRPFLNPGDGSVSKLTHEPRVSVAVLEEMLAPYLSSGRLTVLMMHRPVAADTAGDTIRSVQVEGHGGNKRTITAKYFLDATEQGDLLPLAKVEHVTGAESRKDTGEPHAPEQAEPENIQSFTVCFAMDYRAGENHTIDNPEEYAFWRDYVPQLKPAWPGKLLSWSMANPQTLELRKITFDPTQDESQPGPLNLWLYRRIARAKNYTPGTFASDTTLVNWPQNDYWLGNLHATTPENAARNLKRAKQLSLSLLYWMQTEAKWPGLRLRPDITGTEDGMAMYPYVRESRRIRAEFTITEQQVGTDARKERVAEHFPDSVGVGSYRIDLHPSTGGNNYIDISSLPFEIPLGALIPRRVENLLPASKNLGVTHITNGCYRLHPVEWNIGESAGCLAAEAIRRNTRPRAIRNTPALLKDFQARLMAQGVELAWPKITPR
jgi:hypothetical protein